MAKAEPRNNWGNTGIGAPLAKAVARNEWGMALLRSARRSADREELEMGRFERLGNTNPSPPPSSRALVQEGESLARKRDPARRPPVHPVRHSPKGPIEVHVLPTLRRRTSFRSRGSENQKFRTRSWWQPVPRMLERRKELPPPPRAELRPGHSSVCGRPGARQPLPPQPDCRSDKPISDRPSHHIADLASDLPSRGRLRKPDRFQYVQDIARFDIGDP